MDNTFRDWFILSVSVVLLSSFVAVISFTWTIGYSIASSFQTQIVSAYSEAGLSIIIDFKNIDSVDSTNVYRMIEVNRNIITDFNITNLDGTYTRDLRDLLSRPTDRFSINIVGDSARGYEVEIKEVVSKKVGG